MSTVRVKIKVATGAMAPTRAHDTDAGWDVYTHAEWTGEIEPGVPIDIHTGVQIAVEPGWYYRLVPRSSTMARYGLQVLEGIIDAGYTGELLVRALPVSRCSRTLRIPANVRLAQLIFCPVPVVDWIVVDEMPHTERGEGGFGSSG